MEIKVTIQMLEVLVCVARMPIQYRRIRQQELIDDYKHCLNDFSMKVLHELIEYAEYDDFEVKKCVKHMNNLAARNLGKE